MNPATSAPGLPSAFNRLAWSNLAAQSAEQVGLAAAPIVAVLALGAGAGETGLLHTAQTLGSERTCIVVAALGFRAQAAIILASPVSRLVRQPAMTGEPDALTEARTA